MDTGDGRVGSPLGFLNTLKCGVMQVEEMAKCSSTFIKSLVCSLCLGPEKRRGNRGEMDRKPSVSYS